MGLNWIRRTGLIIGSALALTMLFANLLGLDHNENWGGRRIVLFLGGLLLVFFSILNSSLRLLINRLQDKTARANFAAIAAILLVTLSYVWWVSLGLWTDWPETTAYYDMLARAFSHGNPHLEVQPAPALLALEDPYDPENRSGIPVLWDASLYEGRYYLYWGPAPAVFLVPLTWISDQVIGDHLITLISVAGMYVFLTLTLLHLWQSNYPDIPAGILSACLILAGIINPIPFLLVDPRIYEAAVAAGQFFLLGGIYFLFTGMTKPSNPRFFLAGASLALAASSRTILILPVLFLGVFILVRFLSNKEDAQLGRIGSLILPLMVGAGALLWYNYARFGSVFEFGYGYQLTGFDIHAYINQTYSPTYIPPNVYKYLLNPFEFRQNFPFIKPSLWAGPAWLESHPSQLYYLLAEGITGILIGSPFLILTLIPTKKGVRWIVRALAGSTLMILWLTLSFFYATMRYLLDFVPLLTIMAVLGAWEGYLRFEGHPISRFTFMSLALILWLYTCGFSVLLAFSSNLSRFRTFNPELIQAINLTFFR